MYCTPEDLAAAATAGWDELASRAAPAASGPAIEPELLRAALAGSSLDAWPEDLHGPAQAAATRVQSVIDMASRHIDTYLYPRYRHVMPLAPADVQASSLPGVCAALALRRLYGAAVPEDIRRGTAWADAYLTDLSRGVVSIGQADTATAQPPGEMVSRTRPRTFDISAY